MINMCRDCKATREYPSGKVITECPRCGSNNMMQAPSAKTKQQSDDYLIAAIEGTLADKLLEDEQGDRG